MRKLQLVLISLLLTSSWAFADNGLITMKSHHDVQTTADRLVKTLKKRDMTVFNRINHADGAKKTGQSLRPTELVIFGNPRVGTPLMLCDQRMAIDLPQKALIWQDEAGLTWLSYNNLKHLAKRHNLTGCEQVLSKVETALGNFAKAATAP